MLVPSVSYRGREEIKCLMRDDDIDIIELNFMLNLLFRFDVLSENGIHLIDCLVLRGEGIVDPIL